MKSSGVGALPSRRIIPNSTDRSARPAGAPSRCNTQRCSPITPLTDHVGRRTRRRGPRRVVRPPGAAREPGAPREPRCTNGAHHPRAPLALRMRARTQARQDVQAARRRQVRRHHPGHRAQGVHPERAPVRQGQEGAGPGRAGAAEPARRPHSAALPSLSLSLLTAPPPPLTALPSPRGPPPPTPPPPRHAFRCCTWTAMATTAASARRST